MLTGQASPTNRDIANYLFTNVNGRAPSQAELDAATAAMNSESFQGEWLAGLAGGAQNSCDWTWSGWAMRGWSSLRRRRDFPSPDRWSRTL